MLTFSEKETLTQALCATAEVFGQNPTPHAVAMMAEDLACYPLSVLEDALGACRRELTGRFSLATVLQRIQVADGRPEPNEAWAIALCALDENDSVVLTPEIQLALGAARPVLNFGDKIGARMAFLDAYKRQLAIARRQAKPARWELSLGHDPQRRLLAVEEAERLGRIPSSHVHRYGMQLTHTDSDEGHPILKMISSHTHPNQEGNERLQTLKIHIKRKQRNHLRPADISD